MLTATYILLRPGLGPDRNRMYDKGNEWRMGNENGTAEEQVTPVPIAYRAWLKSWLVFEELLGMGRLWMLSFKTISLQSENQKPE